MIMPREVNHRVSREDRRAAVLALRRSATHVGKSGWNAGGSSYRESPTGMLYHQRRFTVCTACSKVYWK